jgi:hypothetical protein
MIGSLFEVEEGLVERVTREDRLAVVVPVASELPAGRAAPVAAGPADS